MKQITCERCEKPNCSASSQESELCVRCNLEVEADEKSANKSNKKK